MRILIGHSYYAAPGGEDSVFETETATLRKAGHDVVTYAVRTEHPRLEGMRDAVSRGARALWSRQAHRAIAQIIDRERPTIAHFHNVFPNLSVAAFAACRSRAVPVVWTLHNYRLACAAGTFFRNNAACHLCLNWGPFPAAIYGCYHSSRVQSAWVSVIHWFLRKTGTLHSQVARFIALSDFSRREFLKVGIPHERMAVKPNHLAIEPQPRSTIGAAFLYAGRLDRSKGVDVVIRALYSVPGGKLVVAGAGPHEGPLRELAAPLGDRIKFVGHLSKEQLYARLSVARALVLPTLLYENCPVSPIEAFAHGVPVLASNTGGIPELVHDGVNGRLAPPGDVALWARVLLEMLENDVHAASLGQGARRSFEDRYSPPVGLQSLERIYADVMRERSTGVA